MRLLLRNDYKTICLWNDARSHTVYGPHDQRRGSSLCRKNHLFCPWTSIVRSLSFIHPFQMKGHNRCWEHLTNSWICSTPSQFKGSVKYVKRLVGKEGDVPTLQQAWWRKSTVFVNGVIPEHWTSINYETWWNIQISKTLGISSRSIYFESDKEKYRAYLLRLPGQKKRTCKYVFSILARSVRCHLADASSVRRDASQRAAMRSSARSLWMTRSMTASVVPSAAAMEW